MKAEYPCFLKAAVSLKTWQRVIDISKKKKVSISEVVRGIIEKHFSQHEK